MRSVRLFSLVVAGVIAGALLVGTSALAFRAHTAKKTTLKFYFKATSTVITNSAGKRVSPSKLAPGDHLYATVNIYAGTAKHHSTAVGGSAFAFCAITKLVSKTDIKATCDAVLSIGGSMLAGISKQNLAASATTYPITAGTGKYVHVRRGSVKTKTVDKKGDANAVVTIG